MICCYLTAAAFNPIQTGGGGGFCPHGLWTFITFLITKLKPPNLVTFPKIYLGTIWCSKSLSIKFDITMATTSWQAVFSEFRMSTPLNQKSLLFEANFTFLDHFHVNFLILSTSWSILAVFKGFWKNVRNSRGRNPPPPPPGSHKTEKSPVWIGLILHEMLRCEVLVIQLKS